MQKSAVPKETQSDLLLETPGIREDNSQVTLATLFEQLKSSERSASKIK